MKKRLNLIRILITIVFAVLLYYFQLPALNFTDISLYIYLFEILICYIITSSLTLVDVSNVITNVKNVL